VAQGYFVDTERRITYWNRAAARLTGFSALEV
jgi:PAS domain S-box-containing protein